MNNIYFPVTDMVKCVSDSFNIALNAIRNISKAIVELSRKYAKRNKSNNWLKMHGMPMRRRKYRKHR